MGPDNLRSRTVYHTCDLCRRRKTRCVPGPGSTVTAKTIEDGVGNRARPPPACSTCVRLHLECTFLNGYKKPGRPSLSSNTRSRSPRSTRPRMPEEPITSFQDSSSPHVTEIAVNDDRNTIMSREGDTLARPARTDLDMVVPTMAHQLNPMRFGQLYPEDSHDSQLPIDLADVSHASILPLGEGQGVNLGDWWHERDRYPSPGSSMAAAAAAAVVPIRDPSLLPGSTSIAHPSAASTSSPIFQSTGDILTLSARLSPSERVAFERVRFSTDMQLEHIAPWPSISFFVALYLRYMHPLFPLVHKPSFSQALTTRADRTDKSLRSFILGIVAYTIGQSPLSRMVGDHSREELEWLQHRCHRASMFFLDRGYRTLSLHQIGTLMTGYFYCQSIGHNNRAASLLAEACQITHLMRLQDDVSGESDISFVETQQRRRVFWHVYAVDITEASSGHMIHLNSFEGFPQLPLDVDDELITVQGAFPQPEHSPSPMAGFVGCVQLFPILAECIVRHRQLLLRQKQRQQQQQEHENSNDALHGNEIVAENVWVAKARTEIDRIMNSLPHTLKESSADEEMEPTQRSVTGMLRANLLITEASVRLALFDYMAEMDSTSQRTADERASIARTAFKTLSSISLDDLAANGESMRGKILRIVLVLLKCDTAEWLTSLHDWWTLFANIQFVQLMPNDLGSCFPSRAQSPTS